MGHIWAEAAARHARREPFVLATVVWRRAPSSAQVGAKALIAADGSVSGWLGGACAEPEMIVQAREALGEGVPRLVLLGQPDDLSDTGPAGRTTIAMACDSEGAVELYLEPSLPSPQVVAMGRSPAVDALVATAEAAGWSATSADAPSLSRVAVDAATAIVVMSQGHFDDLALQAALDSDAGYVGLVASRKRADATIQLLQDGGMCASHTARVQVPAGLDLGHTTHREMAVAIMADLIRRRVAGELSLDPVAATSPMARTAVDPVCGMTVVVADSHYHAEHEGTTVHFCAAGCRTAFLADPEGVAKG